MRHSFSLSGDRGIEVFNALATSPGFATPPSSMDLDFEPAPVGLDWIERMTRSHSEARAWWPDRPRQLALRPRSGPLVIGTLLTPAITLQESMALIDPLPFELGIFGSVFFDEWIAADYERTSFSRGHISHGWACAFRGKGHDSLVSRRWLDFGPWRVIRRPGDLTFIQFHDLAITDPAEAYAQAWPGHQRMGISETGGFIQHMIEPLVEHVRFGYQAAERRATFVVGPGNPLSQWEMTCARAVRTYHQRNPDAPNPVDVVRFAFVDEEQARAHLHELWLRELECWVADDRGHRRLDADYHPVPDPPAWVKRLDQR